MEDSPVEQSAREYLGGSSERRESLEAWRAVLIFMRTKRRKEQVIVPKRNTVRDEWRLCSGCSPAMRSEI